ATALGAERAIEAALPAIGAGERLRVRACVLAGRQRGERPQPLALGRGAFERPRERGERAAARPAHDVVAVEERGDLVPEPGPLARRALVGRRLAYEVEPARRARARRVEEVAVAGDGVWPLQARADPAPHLVVKERRCRRPARQAPLFEAEHEDDI